MACSSNTHEQARQERAVLVIGTFTASGQEPDRDFVSQAFLKSLAVNLAQVDGLEIVPSAPEVGQRLSGRIDQSGHTIQLRAELTAARGDGVAWDVELRSEAGDLSQLANCLARQVADAVGAAYPAQYPFLGNLTCIEIGEQSPLLRDTIDSWRSNDLERYVADSTELVAREPGSLWAQALNASALAQLWDGASTAETMSLLKQRFTAMDRVDPANPYTDVLLAYAYRSSGEPGRAKELYGRLAVRDDLSPSTRSWILRQRSYAASQTGDWEGARQDAEESIWHDPTSASSYFAFSRVLESLGDLEEATRAAENALALEPSGWRYYQRLGLVLIRRERFDEANLHMDRACRLSERQDACANHAVLLVRAGRDGEAATTADWAGSLPDSSWGRYNLACYQALAGQPSPAIESLGRALALGFADHLIASDSDLDSLRGRPLFDEMVAEAERRYAKRREMTRTALPWQ